ncbi:DUF2971 domain-containing protein [Paenibacillus sinopodophylli]|uniref:DUF2971 domain-containing protein n=1 Tax=Paenibacillus sinopodophylli TaxID=1837342 RepID=UPI00110CE8DF|nr:DUF2971 domain-containing protein [Paenibacillus sinopodophylli]
MDNLIYHFTGATALKSIILNQTFWITKSDYLNDTTELHAIKPFIQKFFKLHNKMSRKVQAYINEQLEKYLTDYNYYILSCSQVDDSLPLWNYYSESEGYSIGIDKEEFINMFERYFQNIDADVKVSITPVRYVADSDETVIKDLLLPVSYFTDQDLLSKKDILDEICFELANMSFSVKHEAYSAEEEERIVVICKKDSALTHREEFRVLNGTFIPYIVFNKENVDGLKVPIKKVKLSPYLTMDVTKKSVLYLVNRKYEDINEKDISQSVIPSRY